jgi:hypothetical protein
MFTLVNLGSVYSQQKDYSKAKDCYEQIVLLAQQTGTRHMEMGRCLIQV